MVPITIAMFSDSKSMQLGKVLMPSEKNQDICFSADMKLVQCLVVKIMQVSI